MLPVVLGPPTWSTRPDSMAWRASRIACCLASSASRPSTPFCSTSFWLVTRSSWFRRAAIFSSYACCIALCFAKSCAVKVSPLSRHHVETPAQPASSAAVSPAPIRVERRRATKVDSRPPLAWWDRRADEVRGRALPIGPGSEESRPGLQLLILGLRKKEALSYGLIGRGPPPAPPRHAPAPS